MNYYDLHQTVKENSDSEKAKILQRFFKTGPGQYGEGDKFAGIKVPVQRKISGVFRTLPVSEIKKALRSEIHEERLISLFILIHQYKNSDEKGKDKIIRFYLKNLRFVNNWDLVDLSAPKLLGTYLLDKDRSVLYKFARSENLWERRIAVLSTFTFIKENDFTDALNISVLLINDKHDLIHKAVGWMLREIGKRDPAAEEIFLKKYYKSMPRTMLRYAIEKFPEQKRRKYLHNKIREKN
ncbi:MAG: DNA alkylation repair protein [Ignavibacteriaceae bacterium]